MYLYVVSFLAKKSKLLNVNWINKYLTDLPNGDKMPALFMGHGSPMNAIEDNEFVKGFIKASADIPTPKAILCLSAHWVTRDTLMTNNTFPETIHDFGGFPEALYDIQYPAPGSPELVEDTIQLIHDTPICGNDQWGLDHGAWSILRHMYPQANIPVVQMSLDHYKSPEQHYHLAKQLKALRSKGVLILGSGNIVHNLGMIAWNKLDVPGYGFDWALEANDKMKSFVLNGDHQSLIKYEAQGKAFKLAIPTPEHYLPLIYVLATQDKDEEVGIFNDAAIGGSLTMTSFTIG